MTAAVLDASALLALLRTAPGQKRVPAVIADAAMSTVNLSEVTTHYARRGSSEENIRALVDHLPFVRVPLADDLAYATGMLMPLARAAGLSLGDRTCLARARRLGVPALTTDPAWQAVAGPCGVTVGVVR